MKRLFSTENLIEAAITIIAIIASTVAVYGQDVPTPQPPAPTPTPVLSIEGPTEGKRDDFNDLTVIGHPADCTFDWFVVPFDHKLSLRESEKGKVLTIVGPPGQYILIVSVSNGSAKQSAKHLLTIPGDVPVPPGPNPPPAVKTLRDLAGLKADNVSKAYVQLLDGIGKGLLETREEFNIAEEITLKQRDCVEHGAKAEIAKRLTVPFEQLKVAVKLIVDELGAATPVPTPSNAAVTYVYEKDNGEPSSGVMAGLNRLNREKNLKATIFEEDTVDGSGQVPDQYKVALDAARAAGLPALVVTAGEKVVNVVKNPTTAEQVWGAAP